MKRWDQKYHDALEAAKLAGVTQFEGPPCKRCQRTRRRVGNLICLGCDSDRLRAKHEAKPLWRAFVNARSRAKKADMDFDLVYHQLTIPALCPVFQTPMVKPSLDRRDNDKGYTRENTFVISDRANRLKNNLSLKEVKMLAIYMEDSM